MTCVGVLTVFRWWTQVSMRIMVDLENTRELGWESQCSCDRIRLLMYLPGLPMIQCSLGWFVGSKWSRCSHFGPWAWYSPDSCLSSNKARIGLRVALWPIQCSGVLGARRGFVNSQLSDDMSVNSMWDVDHWVEIVWLVTWPRFLAKYDSCEM